MKKTDAILLEMLLMTEELELDAAEEREREAQDRADDEFYYALEREEAMLEYQTIKEAK